MKLSVVIPARNEEGAVAETLSALLRTLYVAGIPCELIVVDDGSTDKTALLVQEISVRYSEIRLVQNTGRPVWAARGARRDVRTTLTDIFHWLRTEEQQVRPLFVSA